MKVSIVTTCAGDRAPVLRRLVKHAPWIRGYEWILSGPKELAQIAKELGAIHVPADVVIGTGRNLAAEHATGDILINVDDDDWQNYDRVRKQVAALTTKLPSGLLPELVGTSWIYCLVAERKIATRISLWDRNYMLPGCTLAYYKESWKSHPFPDQMSEDGPFTGFFLGRGTALDMRDPKLIVYFRLQGRSAHHVLDWWEESRHRMHAKSALEIMRDRIQNPQLRMRGPETDVAREAALAHEEESSTVYVRSLMGADFDLFCEPFEGRWEPNDPRRVVA